MSCICIGMHAILHGLKTEGVIKDVQAFPPVNYEQRYSLFSVVEFPKYKSYEDYEQATAAFLQG